MKLGAWLWCSVVFAAHAQNNGLYTSQGAARMANQRAMARYGLVDPVLPPKSQRWIEVRKVGESEVKIDPLEMAWKLRTGVIRDTVPVHELLAHKATVEGSRKGDWRSISGNVFRMVPGGMLVEVAKGRGIGEKQIVLVANVPEAGKLVDGNPVNVLAMRVGNAEYGGLAGVHTVAKFDHGTILSKEPYPEAAVKPAEKADDGKVIEWLRTRSEAGSASAQYDLAIRYLAGNGVPTNQTAAIDLLARSAGQGHEKARQKLKELGGASFK